LEDRAADKCNFGKRRAGTNWSHLSWEWDQLKAVLSTMVNLGGFCGRRRISSPTDWLPAAHGHNPDELVMRRWTFGVYS